MTVILYPVFNAKDEYLKDDINCSSEKAHGDENSNRLEVDAYIILPDVSNISLCI
jgi:hypothetical protein